MAKRRARRRRGRLLRLAAAAAAAAAIIKELRTPAPQRTWHGKVAGIPYDFRPPTAGRVRAEWWSPDDPRILRPHAFGVGWGLNVGRLVRLLRRPG